MLPKMPGRGRRQRCCFLYLAEAEKETVAFFQGEEVFILSRFPEGRQKTADRARMRGFAPESMQNSQTEKVVCVVRKPRGPTDYSRS